MSLIHEYGEKKYNDGKAAGIEQGIEKIIKNLLESGEKPEDIAEKTKVELEKIIEIKNKNEL
jgi:hypothetical protein